MMCSEKSIIDLLTIIPLYVVLTTESKHWGFTILKFLRSLRIVRFFNMIQYFINVKENRIFENQEHSQEYYGMSSNMKVKI